MHLQVDVSQVYFLFTLEESVLFSGNEVSGYAHRSRQLTYSVAVVAEILLRSPWKLFIFTIKKYIYRRKASKKKLI